MRSARTPLPREVRALATVSALNDTASEMVYPLLPAFIVTTLGGSATSLAALDGLGDFTSALLRLPAGRWADRPKLRPSLVFGGYAVAVFARAAIAGVRSVEAVIALRMTDRLGKGLRSPGRDAMLAEAVAPEYRGRAFGVHRAADHGGAVLGALIGWALLQYADLTPREVIAGSLVPGLLVLIVLAWMLRSRTPKPSAAIAGPRSVAESLSGSESPPPRFRVSIGALTFLLVSRLPESLLLLHLQQQGVAQALIPLGWAGLHVVRSGVAYPAGRLVDEIGERGVIAASGMLAVGGAGALALARSPAALLGAFLAYGLVTGLAEPAEKRLVSRLAPQGMGRAFGEAQTVLGVAALVAALGYGVLVDRSGTRVALMVAALVGAMATGVWLAVSRSRSAAS